ncbi:regulator of telomere elongation helicase 1-like [Oscarella lobularis]|uniref:regulator of telomere elongation helicase 1-like n=1 Tax=Oscarella lobularis TaxID=121494 RepID=UPI0033140A0A
MPSLKIRGLDVQFPFDPYPPQRDYMEKVVECLQEGKNGILESPTGTGKTLCLLCAALAWQESLKSEKTPSFFPDDSKKEKSWETEAVSRPVVPKIIYSSRTHSQLTQAIHELKNTQYKPVVTILGSRDQLCLNPVVSRATTNTEKVHLCRSKVQSHTCRFYNNLEAKSSDMASLLSQRMPDIEDLVQEGARQTVCPYYLARELKASAELIFMPYNYILDIKSRKAHGIDLRNTIVICDEAHNIEKMCEDASSFDLSSFDVACCLEDIIRCIDTKKKEKESLIGGSGQLSTFDGDEGKKIDEEMESMYCVKAIMVNLEKAIDGLDIPRGEDGLTRPGSFMAELLKQCQLNESNYLLVIDQCEQMLLFLTNSFHKSYSLQKFVDMIRVVYQTSSSSHQHHTYYKVHVRPSPERKSRSKIETWTSGTGKNPSTSAGGRTLSYWCFSPGHAMNDLTAQGVHSLILTSGTLSPLSSFSAELKIPFPVSIENPHVIERHQVFAGVVTCGPDRVTLNSSYQNRFSLDYLSSLGKTLVRLASVVPNGFLVFFPSYPLMSKCVETWQQSDLWNKLSERKPVFLEPKGKTDFNQTIDAFYEKIRDPSCRQATFLAVCRGKAAEGLDFADVNGRAVVITGLPFPPKMDPKVKLKMLYLDEAVRATSKESLSGNTWYCQQASRAVNQAIGRVIRHRHDFGALLLCDSRFSARNVQLQLPKWVRPSVTTYDDFEKLFKDLGMFFTYAERTLPPPRSKNSSVAQYKPNSDARNDVADDFDTFSSSSKYPVPIQFRPALKRRADSLTRKFQQAQRVESHVSSLAPKTEISLKNSEEISSKKKKITEKDGKKGKAAEAKAYLQEVKEALSDESYKRFSHLLAEYQKNSELDSFVSGLHKIFGQSVVAMKRLLEGLQKFLKAHHKEPYLKLCLELSSRKSPETPSAERLHPKQSTGKLMRDSKDSTKDLAKDSEEPASKKLAVTALNETHSASAPISVPNLQRLQSEKFCPVCKKKLRGPYLAPCKHVCCSSCWRECLKIAEKCPVCEQPVSKQQLQHKYLL